MVPRKILAAYRHYTVGRLQRRAQLMSTREVFTYIYANNRWGGARGTFCSGSGSNTSAIVTPYIVCMREQLAQLGAQSLDVVDLGCGDFSVGRQLADECRSYVGVDIVASLIRRNEAQFGTDRVAFRCLDIIEDELPEGHICFVRQVLQHLSNEQIARILPKLARYEWVFITEHQPSPGHLRVPNLDKPHGGDIRVRQSSGVFLEHPPFVLPREFLRLLLEVPGHAGPEGEDPGVIRTFVLHHANNQSRNLVRSVTAE